jgi:hypothetical protein
MNIRALSIAFVLTLAIGATGAQTIDETKPYGRTCVTVVDSKTKAESVLTADLKPAAECTVAVHLEANTAGEAIIAAFSKIDGTLANGWLPVIVQLEDWEEQTAPPAREPWAWVQTGKPFDVFVVFLPKGQPLAGKALGLVAKIRDGKADGATQNLQARQLREELRRWAASESAVSARPENAPTKAGVTLRGVRFPWRDHARTTNFSAEKPGVIIYRHDGP